MRLRGSLFSLARCFMIFILLWKELHSLSLHLYLHQSGSFEAFSRHLYCVYCIYNFNMRSFTSQIHKNSNVSETT
ncbi:uncharacterized protein LAJ45_09050 [Morchella importuna]|uniref:uncharacterized protein n=1 Tax=Morchella importuna TaxID=1174673 RepID=UPI001E8E0435|nr:uncharacterized protein LAJ45_09050 [Morchella importuna]KAH8146969.1 hypothetical protein LAJ45_09050 [Morchella importuna]